MVKPVKGTAILWYNHHLNPDHAQSMGIMDKFSLHGGCDVRKGIKWIANNWLNANMQAEHRKTCKLCYTSLRTRVSGNGKNGQGGYKVERG